MADREQIWTILADFSSLTRNARDAARAVKDLDKARNKANENAGKPIINEKDAKWLEHEATQLDKLTVALQTATKARREDTAATTKGNAAQRQAAIATLRATTARRADADSLNAHASAASSHATALSTSTTATKNFNSTMGRSRASTRNHTRNLIGAANAARNMSNATSFLNKAITDTIPVSRSWSLIMKMLPLTAVTSGINTLIPTINGLGGAFVGLLSTITPVFGILGALPTMAVAAAGSIGGLIAGLTGVGQAFGAWRKMEEAQTKASQKSTAAADRSARARERSVRNTNRSLQRAARDQARAAEDVREAEARIGEVARDNARAIADAEKTVADAQMDARRAQVAVNAAREQAARSLQTYRNQLKGAALDEESAAMELQRSRAALAAVIADPGATSLERQGANLAVRQAELRLEEVRSSSRDLEKEAAAARAKGVEGADAVVGAKENEAEANERVAEAQQDLNRTYESNAKSTLAAQKALRSAQESYADSGQRIQDLREDLEDLNDQLAETAESPAAAQVAAFDAAMAKLGPNARLVVGELIALSEAWQLVKRDASEAMAPGLLSFLRDLRYTLLPAISDYLALMAGGAGDFFEELGNLLTTRRSLERLNIIFKDSYDFMELLGEATLNVTDWLLGLGVAAERSGLTVWIGDTIRRWTEGWKESVDTPQGIINVSRAMEDAMYYAEMWGEAIGATWGFLRTFFRNFRPLGEWVLGNITDTMDAWNDWMNSDSGQDKVRTWRTLARINLSGFANMIRTIADQGDKLFNGIDFQSFWDALNGTGQGDGFINALGSLLGIVNEDMIVNVVELGSAIMGVLQSFGEAGGMATVVVFVDLLDKLAGITDSLIKNVPLLAEGIMVLIGVAASKKAAVAFGSLLGITPMFTAINSAKGQGYSKGDGLGVAATRQYLGWGNFNPDRTTEAGAQQWKDKADRRSMARGQAPMKQVGPSLWVEDLDRVKELGGSVDDLGRKTSRYRRLVNGLKGAWSAVGGAVKSIALMAVIGVAFDQFAKLQDWLKGTVGTAAEAETAILNFNRSFDNSPADAAERASLAFDNLFDGVKKAGGGTHDLESAVAALNAEVGVDFWDTFLMTPAQLRDFNDISYNADAVRESMLELDKALTSADPEEAAASFKVLRDQFEAAGMPVEELLKLFPEYSAQIQNLASQNGLGELSNNHLADAMEGVYPPLRDITGALKDNEDAMEDHNETMDESIAKWREEKDAIDEWKTAVDKARGVELDLQEAQDRATRTRLEMDTDFAELEAGERNLDSDNLAGLDNRDKLRGYAGDILAVASAMNEVNGNTIAGNKYIEDQRDLLYNELVESWGLNETEAKEFLDTLQLYPDDVTVDVLVETKKLSKEQIAEINDTLVQFPPEIRAEILVEAQTEGYDAAKKAIEFFDKYRNGIYVPVNIGGAQGLAQTDAKGNVKEVTFPRSGGITMKASGGPISGPGTATSDSIPALLSDGEYVVRTKAARQLGESTLNYINRTGRLPGFKTGGAVRVKKYATGGRVTGGASLLSQANSITGTFSALSGNLGRWGNGVQVWWRSLWNSMSLGLGYGIAKIATQLGTPWNKIWTSTQLTATGTLLHIITAIRTTTPAMGAAWKGFMDSMQTPIRTGIEFINNTLGVMVNKVGSFYGVTSSPFPIDVPGFAGGGWTGPGSRLQPAGIVHADEYVIRKDSRKRIERQAPGFLDHLNRTGSPGYASGGRVRPTGRESGNYPGHSGIDYAVPVGTPVRAADEGIIASVRRLTTSYGWHIIQQFANGLRGVYAHMSGFNVNPGDRVNKGQVIGRSGNSGNSRGPHLHLEVTGGSFGDPANRLFTRNWLGQQSEGIGNLLGSGASVMGALDPMSALTSMVSSPSGALRQLTNSMGSSGWGEIVGKVISSVANMPAEKLGASAVMDAIGNFGAGDQRANAFGIIDIAMRRGLGQRGALLGLMTAMQESSLKNLRGGDRDSVGLFQQRPSQGWGSVAQIMDPSYSANKFFNALLRIRGWQTGPEWEDIQAVQISAFPTAYQKHKGRALQYLQEWAATRGAGFASGGWTGPGSRNKPAGIVHADEYVINKNSRKRIESVAPGMLDYMNAKGTLPGYATGGKVGNPATWATPRALRNLKVYTSYLQHAQSLAWSGKSVPETKPHVQMIENLLAHEGLLWRRDADGWFGRADSQAWTAWQRRAGYTATGRIDQPSLEALLKKYKIANDPSTPFVPGFTQPRGTDVVTNALKDSNVQMAEYYAYMSKFRAMGLSHLSDQLKQLGPNGIPEEFRDSVNPTTGMMMARTFFKDSKAARDYNEALKEAAKYGEEVGGMASKMEQMLALLQYGEDGPYGMQTLARELGVSLDTAVMLYKKLNANGSLKNLTPSRTARARGDVADFDNLFKFANGGLVPGTGNHDSVFALLTPGELVIPKDVVASMFRPSSQPTTFADFTARVSSRTDTTVGNGGNVYQFNTTVNNPVAEPSSVSIQKRVKATANLGLLGGRES